MIDIKLNSNQYGIFDMLITDGVSEEETLKTAIIISLFSDARSSGERGSAIDSLYTESWGSREWTLEREKLTPQTAQKLEEFTREALKWLITEKIAKSIQVTTEIVKPKTIIREIKIFKPDGSVLGYRFSNIWGE